MKKVFNILLGSAIVFSFAQCGSSKGMYKLEKKTPFSIEKATYMSWVAGVRGGGSGVDVVITLEAIDATNANDMFSMEKIYFNNQITTVELKPNTVIGRFKTKINQQKDIILHKDAEKEFGNEAPKMLSKFPFELKEGEAIISYKQKGKLKYFKLKLTKKASPLYQ